MASSSSSSSSSSCSSLPPARQAYPPKTSSSDIIMITRRLLITPSIPTRTTQTHTTQTSTTSMAAAAAFQSLEGKIESMQREHKEKLRALEGKKREAQAMQEDLVAFRQAKHLLDRKAAVLNMQLQQANLKLLDSQVQTEAVTHATQELQCLLALYQQQQQQPSPTTSTTTTSHDNNDDDTAATAAASAAPAPAAGSGVLTTLLEEGRKWEAKGLESEVQLRLFRRLNLLMEEKTWELQRKLEEKQEEKSRLVRQNLRSEESARLVSVHEAMVAQKRALQQQRGIKMRVWQQVESKKVRLEDLKKKAQAMDVSLRAEEASYMDMHSAAAAAAPISATAAGAGGTAAAAAAETAAAAVVIPSTPAQEEEAGRRGRRLEEGKEEAEKGKRQRTDHQQEGRREEGFDLSLACDV